MFIDECSFESNSSKEDGGAVRFTGGNLDVDKTLFIDNSSEYNGGAIYSDNKGGRCDIRGSVFDQNSADNGGGCYIISDGSTERVQIVNSVFSNNQAITSENFGNGGGVYFDNTSTEREVVFVINSTFYGNEADNDIDPGDAIYMKQFHDYKEVLGFLYNTILWGSDEQFAYNNFYRYSCWIQDIKGASNPPLFLNAGDPDGNDDLWFDANDGLNLTSESECIDNGEYHITPGVIPNKDITEYDREPGKIDIGAYEFRK